MDVIWQKNLIIPTTTSVIIIFPLQQGFIVCSLTDIQKYVRFYFTLYRKKVGGKNQKWGANAFLSSTQCEENFGQKKLKVK
jgi:hypothetical protein